MRRVESTPPPGKGPNSSCDSGTVPDHCPRGSHVSSDGPAEPALARRSNLPAMNIPAWAPRWFYLPLDVARGLPRATPASPAPETGFKHTEALPRPAVVS